MDEHLAELVWRGIQEANPWWTTGKVPAVRTRSFRRHAFETLYRALKDAEPGRGVVVLGPRRVGKTVLLHQIVERLLEEGAEPEDLCLLSLDDVALRDRDLGDLLHLLEVRRPRDRMRTLLLDEVQHSPTWAGWLKRLADRRDPYVFLATGSSATALRRGGQDAGVGRWREMTLFPWSFREHVALRALPAWHFQYADRVAASERDASEVLAEIGPPPFDESERLEEALIDYLLRGGFPEASLAPDLAEARRRIRQDILDRALGRDVSDIMSVDSRQLERMFLRICLAPGGLWNETEVARDLKISAPTVRKYLQILEELFLVFRLPNLGSPVKGQPKVYLVAPALRQALLGLNDDQIRRPEEWGQLVENAVAAIAVGTRPQASQIGFWRRDKHECDVVVVNPGANTEYIEVKRSGRNALAAIQRCADDLGHPGVGWILRREARIDRNMASTRPLAGIYSIALAYWLYWQRDSAGGTLRIRVS